MTSLFKAVDFKAVEKKRGRPVGSKNTKPRNSFKQAAIVSQNAKVVLLTKRVDELKILVDELQLIRERLHSVIDRQEYKAVQYQAVIDYLETKLELK
jgi:hypothetical protein